MQRPSGSKSHLSIYVDDHGRSALHCDGFTWLGGLMLPIWAISRRMWLTSNVAAIFGPVFSQLVVDAISKLDDPYLTAGFTFLYLLLWVGTFGGLANRWHRFCLERAGYRLIATELREKRIDDSPHDGQLK